MVAIASVSVSKPSWHKQSPGPAQSKKRDYNYHVSSNADVFCTKLPQPITRTNEDRDSATPLDSRTSRSSIVASSVFVCASEIQSNKANQRDSASRHEE
jgi:hypothetical protein